MCITSHHRADEYLVEWKFASISSIPYLYTIQIIIHFLFHMECEHIQYAITYREDIYLPFKYENNNTNSCNGNEIDIHLTIYFRMMEKYYKP